MIRFYTKNARSVHGANAGLALLACLVFHSACSDTFNLLSDRLLVVFKHILVLFGHPRVETSLLILVDVHGVVERGEVSELIVSARTTQESNQIFQRSQRSRGSTESVVEQHLRSLSVVVYNLF